MKKRRILACTVVGWSACLTTAALAGPLKIVLPAETAAFQAGPGAETAMAQCLQCHSAEYITSQPPLGKDAWKASIGKMRAKYGATVSPEAEAVLVEYLAGTYGKPLVPAPQR